MSYAFVLASLFKNAIYFCSSEILRVLILTWRAGILFNYNGSQFIFTAVTVCRSFARLIARGSFYEGEVEQILLAVLAAKASRGMPTVSGAMRFGMCLVGSIYAIHRCVSSVICATGVALSANFIHLNMTCRVVTAAITLWIYDRRLRGKYLKHIHNLRTRHRGVRIRSTVWWLLVAQVGFVKLSFLYSTFSVYPDRSLSSHFYGLTTAYFDSMERSRLVFLLDWSALLFFEFSKFWVIVCVYWELVFVVCRYLDKVKHLLDRHKDAIPVILKAKRLMETLNEDFGFLLFLWLIELVSSIIGIVHVVLRSLSSSQAAVEYIAKDPDQPRMLIMFVIFVKVLLRIRSRCRKLEERLDELVLKSDYGKRQNLVKLKLIRNACSLDVFTVRVWDCIELKEEFVTGTFKSVLLYGVTLYQVGA